MKKRIFYLDIIRSFAIIMVLVLHSINYYITEPFLFKTNSWYINLFLNAFARTGVPLFFMLSGCLALSSDNTKNYKVFYKKVFNRIVIPLIFWNIIYYIYKCIAGYIDFDIKTLLSDFLNCGTEYHLWYLYTLGGIYLIAPFLKILIEHCSIKQLCWLLFLMLFGTTIRPFINTVTPLYIYFSEPLFNGYISCFLMGWLLNQIKISTKVVGLFIVSGLISLIFSAAFHHINSSNDHINLYFNYGYSICHYSLAASLFIVLKAVFREKILFGKFITTLSVCSFGIYLTHVIIIDLILNYFMIDASPVFSAFYIFIITFSVSFAVSFFLGKIKYIKNII